MPTQQDDAHAGVARPRPVLSQQAGHHVCCERVQGAGAVQGGQRQAGAA